MSRTSLSKTIPTIMNICEQEQCVLVNSLSPQLHLKTNFNKEELGELIEMLVETHSKMK